MNSEERRKQLFVVFVREDKFGREIYRDTKTNQECMTASGVWFTITQSGAPLSPIMCDKVTIDYRGFRKS